MSYAIADCVFPYLISDVWAIISADLRERETHSSADNTAHLHTHKLTDDRTVIQPREPYAAALCVTFRGTQCSSFITADLSFWKANSTS